MSNRVYLGRLPYGTREDDVKKFFYTYGRFKIREIILKDGYGFVEFDYSDDAEDAVYECNGKKMLGERILVEPARGTSKGGYSSGRRGRARDKYGPPLRTPWRMTVENLSSRVSWQDLKDYCRQIGDVTYGDAHKQKQGEGVIEFATKKDLKKALRKLDGKELKGKRIRLIDESPRSHSRSRSRSRSRSKSRSHSRSKSRSRSRSNSPSRKSRKRRHSSRSRSKSHSRSKSRSKSRSRSRSRSRSKSRSRSPRRSKSRSRSPSPKRDKVDDEARGGSPPPKEGNVNGDQQE